MIYNLLLLKTSKKKENSQLNYTEDIICCDEKQQNICDKGKIWLVTLAKGKTQTQIAPS